MRRLLSPLLLAAFVCSAIPASAQVVWSGATTIIAGGTNNVAATTTNTYNLRIDTPRSSEFALYVSARPHLNASNIVTLLLTLQPSIDGTTVANTEPTQTYALTGTTNSTGLVIGVTNVTAGAVPFYFLTTGENTEGLAATNLTVSYGVKRER